MSRQERAKDWMRELLREFYSPRTLITLVVIGWSAHKAITSVRDEARLAISAVSEQVADVRLEVRGHVTMDDQRFMMAMDAQRDLAARLNLCCYDPRRR